MKTIFRLSLTILRIYMREPLTVFLSIGLLVLMMVLFGVMSGGDMANLHLGVAVLDKTRGQSSQLRALDRDPVLTLRPAASEDELTELIRTAQVIGGVIVEPGLQPQEPALRLIVSDSPQNHWTAVGVEHLRAVLSGKVQQSSIPVEYLHVNVINNRFIDFIFPGVLALSILQACLGSAVVLLDAKKNGVLRRLQLTPMKPLQIYTGFLAGRCVIVLAHLLVLSLVAIALFRAQILSSVPAAIFVVVLGILCFMPMAGVVAMLSPSFEAGNIIIQLLNFPMAFLCGVFFRNENMPHILQAVVKFMPLTYLVDLMRGTIQAGLPLNRFPLQIAVLSAWSAASLIVIALSGRVKALSQN